MDYFEGPWHCNSRWGSDPETTLSYVWEGSLRKQRNQDLVLALEEQLKDANPDTLYNGPRRNIDNQQCYQRARQLHLSASLRVQKGDWYVP